jgi:hypothetical protein
MMQINTIKALSIKQINKWNCFFNKWREFLLIWQIYIFKNTRLIKKYDRHHAFKTLTSNKLSYIFNRFLVLPKFIKSVYKHLYKHATLHVIPFF